MIFQSRMIHEISQRKLSLGNSFPVPSKILKILLQIVI